MDLPTLSGAAAIALATTLLFALLVRGWQIVSERYARPPVFAGTMMNDAAQRIRDQWLRDGRQQSAYVLAGLVFVIVFVTAWLLGRGALPENQPAWQSIVLLLAVTIAAAAGLCRIVRLSSARRRLRLQRDASLVTGHALQKLNGNLNRVFHDVPCSAGIVDHVVIGLHGLYAIHVVARRPGKDNRVTLEGDVLQFASRHAPVSIAPFLAVARRLARECSRSVGHEVHARCVVSVPGWESHSQSRRDVLLVNERSIPMVSGWTDPRDYLLNEDVESLHELLSQRSARTRSAS